MTKNVYLTVHQGEHTTYESPVDALLPFLGKPFCSWDDKCFELDASSLQVHIDLLEKYGYLESEDGLIRVHKTVFKTAPKLLSDKGSDLPVTDIVIDGNRVAQPDGHVSISRCETLTGEKCYALFVGGIAVLIGRVKQEQLFIYQGQKIEVFGFEQLRGDNSTKRITSLAITHEVPHTIFNFRDVNDRSVLAFYVNEPSYRVALRFS